LCYDAQDPTVLGETLSAERFDGLLRLAEERAEHVKEFFNEDGTGTGNRQMEQQLAEMMNLLAAMKQAQTTLSEHQASSERNQKIALNEYNKWYTRYNETAVATEQKMAENERLVVQGAARTQSLFTSLQRSLLDAVASIETGINNPSRTAYYESQVLSLATLTQSLIEQVDAIQMNTDGDYLMQQTLNTLMVNLYGNVGPRRTLARAFRVPPATQEQQDAGITPQSPLQELVRARQMELLVDADLPLPDTTRLTKHYFEAAFVWNTYLDYDAQQESQEYWDVDVGATLAEIDPAGYSEQSDGLDTSLKVAAYLMQSGGGGSGTARLYANYRRFDVYCSEAYIVSLQNSWTSFLQLQQMLGPDGCSIEAGTCRCWAYVRRQRCTLAAGNDALFSASYFAAHPTSAPNQDNVMVPTVPQSLADLGVICANSEDNPLADEARWFTSSVDLPDVDGHGRCTVPSEGVQPPAASGRPSCEPVTDIVAFNDELHRVCNQTVRAEPTGGITRSSRTMNMWIHTQPAQPLYLNVTYGLCNTNYQIMAIQSNIARSETIPFAFYTQQQAALGQYVKLAARAYEIQTYGYVPRHGTSSQQPYYVQGAMRASNTSRYLADVRDGALTSEWVDPVRLLDAQTMSYGAVSRENIPIYRLTRRSLQQSIALSCQVPGTDDWVAQAAQDIVIEPDVDSVEPTMFTWVGWLDHLYLPEEHAFAVFRNSQGQLVNRTRYLFAVPDEAVSAGGPLETRKHKIDYVRCGRTCLDARAKAIDPTYTADDLQQLYDGDQVSLAIDAALRSADPPLPGLQFHTAINDLRSTAITAEEFLAAEARPRFDVAAMGDSAREYFHPVVLEDGSGYLALQELQADGDPSYTPVLDMSGPIPLRCDMAWFAQHNMQPTRQCRFLESHRPIATLDPVYKQFESWDKASAWRLALKHYRTTFSIVVAGSSFVGEADAVVVCPPPHLIQLLTSSTGASYAAPQLRIYNDKMYEVSLRVRTVPTSNTGRNESCLVYDEVQTLASQQAVIVTLPFSTVCDGLAIKITEGGGGLGGGTPPICWSWSGNLTQELAANRLEQLHASRVGAGMAVSTDATQSLQSGLDLTAQVLAQQVSANEMVRVSMLYNALATYNAGSAAAALRALNQTQRVTASGQAPTLTALQAFRALIAQTKYTSSNQRALILAAGAKSAADYANVLDAAQNATDARLAFARTSADVMANLTSTAAYLNARYYSAQSLRDRAAASNAKLAADVATLEAKTQLLSAIFNVFGTMPTSVAGHTYFNQPKVVYDDLWDSLFDDLLDGLRGLPGAALALVKQVLKAALDLMKDLLCSTVPLLCNPAILILILIIACAIAFCCLVSYCKK
jgi:hypothetical protein